MEWNDHILLQNNFCEASSPWHIGLIFRECRSPYKRIIQKFLIPQINMISYNWSNLILYIKNNFKFEMSYQDVSVYYFCVIS